MKPSTILKWLFIFSVYLMSIKPIHALPGVKCSATKKDGTACSAWSQKGQTVCFIHNPANRCEGTNKSGVKCGGMKVKGSKFCNNHQNQVK